MKNVKKKNIAAFCCTALFFLLFLLNNFTLVGAFVSAILLLCLYLSTCATHRGAKAEYGIIDNIGDYFGLTLFDLMLVSILYRVEVQTGNIIDSFVDKITSSRFSPDIIAPAIGIVAGTFVVCLILAGTHTSSMDHISYDGTRYKGSMVAYVIKYIILGVGSFFLLNAFVRWETNLCIGLLLVYLAVNIFIEKIYEKNSNLKKSKTVFNWCVTIIIVFSALQYIWPEYTLWFIDDIINTSSITWAWYLPYLIGIVMAFLGSFSYWLDSDSRKSVMPFDSKLCLAIAVNLIAIPVSIALYNEYISVLYIALAIINIIFFATSPKETKRGSSDAQNIISFGKYLLEVVGLFILWYTFIAGSFIFTLVLFAAVICGVILYQNSKFVEGVGFWIYVILASAVLSAVSVYTSFNSTVSYGYIIAVAIISIFAIIILNVKNKLRFTGNVIAKTIVVAAAFVMIIFPVRSFGVDFDIEIDNDVAKADAVLAEQGLDTNKISVTVTPREKGNKIEVCEFYWDDAETHEKAAYNEDGVFTLEPRNGVLHIYAKDTNGVSSTLTRRFNFKDLNEARVAGTVKVLAVDEMAKTRREEAIEFGETVIGRPDIGASVTSINDKFTAYYYFRSKDLGVYITSLEYGYNENVLEFGDRIVSINGREIATAEDVNAIINENQVGANLTFNIVRDGEPMTVTVTLYEM